MAISDAKKKANQRWNKKNKGTIKYSNYRSYAKTFISTLANNEDLQALKDLIKVREKELK
jgi:conserved domain protein|nr:MAG TPA: hypothetical protein [Caudoviricetes sp.]